MYFIKRMGTLPKQGLGLCPGWPNSVKNQGEENTELLDQINASLKKLQDSGEIDKIINKYIKAE